MIIAVIKEITPGEKRIAVTPDIASRLVNWGFQVRIETQAGLLAGFSDDAFRQAGAVIVPDAVQACRQADYLFKIWAPLPQEDNLLHSGLTVIANFQARSAQTRLKQFASLGIDCFALDLMPRISRAQSMDILSSQSNLAGYKAVLTAVNHLNKAVPMMMTAAGTVTPAKVLVLGAGVAGLQAIATAKRLGAQVYASDIRPQVKEQIESLGARFVEVKTDENFETSGGYAKEASADYKQKQELAVAEQLRKTDIAITTALIPGRPAPRLINRNMLKDMPQGSVIIDMATASGGNVEGSVDNQTVTVNNVTIIGNSNLASELPYSASMLFAKNIFNFLTPMYNDNDKRFIFNFEDELVKGTCVCRNGQFIGELN